jgi:hypothetical protein
MITRERHEYEGTFTVTSRAMRPACNEHRCFYCRVPIGADHKSDCVLISRRVVVRLESEGFDVSHEYEIVVPAAWTAEDIEFHRNDSSWCADNALDELPSDVVAKLGRTHDEDDEDATRDCLCGAVSFVYVGEVEGERGAAWLDEK